MKKMKRCSKTRWRKATPGGDAERHAPSHTALTQSAHTRGQGAEGGTGARLCADPDPLTLTGTADAGARAGPLAMPRGRGRGPGA